MYKTASAVDTEKFGRALGGLLLPGDTVFLRGDLGAGKSVLVRGIAAALGVEGPMPSPTFTLMQPYGNVHHFDLYRLTDEDEFFSIGLDEFIGGESIALIEWPFEGMDFTPCAEITIDRGCVENERQIQLELVCMEERDLEIRNALRAWEEPN